VVEQAISLCRFDDPEYKGPASDNDLLSYYNQRDHLIIDRHLIKDALEKLARLKQQAEAQSRPTTRIDKVIDEVNAKHQEVCKVILG